MTIFNLYIFDREGTCLYYGEWNRRKNAGISRDEEFKLMYGMIFSMKSFTQKMSPMDMKTGFQNIQTSRYKLHYYETPSGLKFIMNTDLTVDNMRVHLHQMYSSIYVEYVVKNPLASLSEPITSELFKTKLDDYVRGLPMFAAKLS